MEHHHKKQNNKDTKERENKENEISRASGRKIQNKIFSYELDFIELHYRFSKNCINFMDFCKVLK